MLRFLIVLILSTTITLSQVRQDTSQIKCKPCRQHPSVIGPSFVVHGALRMYPTGPPTIRIWKIGTNRMLGISEGMYYLEGYCNLPKWLDSLLTSDSAVTKSRAQIIGDFVVYPFMNDEPGEMRLVCVDTAYNLRTIPWR
jgi:hypothetical protein